MPNLSFTPKTLVVTFATPVNASPNVTLENVNINVAALLGSDPTIGADYSALAETLLVKGLWNGNQFIPAWQITLITAVAT